MVHNGLFEGGGFRLSALRVQSSAFKLWWGPPLRPCLSSVVSWRLWQKRPSLSLPSVPDHARHRPTTTGWPSLDGLDGLNVQIILQWQPGRGIQTYPDWDGRHTSWPLNAEGGAMEFPQRQTAEAVRVGIYTKRSRIDVNPWSPIGLRTVLRDGLPPFGWRYRPLRLDPSP